LDHHYRDLKTLREAGVRFMPGSDEPAFTCPTGALIRELELFVEKLGMTPHQALASATTTPAELFGMRESLGTIEEGKMADLVLLRANPLDSISNVRLIDGVVAGGRYLSSADIRKLRVSR
jgi:imidazolonepropionase-like amidohydrolase